MKSSDALDRLLAEARHIAERRDKALEGIRQTEAALLEQERKLAVSRQQQEHEEFEAAQADGGLAVASRATQEAVTKAELRVKSAGLRLQGLQPKLARIEEALLRAREAVKAHVKGMLETETLNLSRDFDAAVESLICMAQKAFVLRKFAPTLMERDFFGLGGIRSLQVFNPLRTIAATFTAKPTEVTGSGMQAGLVWWQGRNLGGLGKVLLPEADALHGELQALQDLTSPAVPILSAPRPEDE